MTGGGVQIDGRRESGEKRSGAQGWRGTRMGGTTWWVDRENNSCDQAFLADCRGCCASVAIALRSRVVLGASALHRDWSHRAVAEGKGVS